MANPTPTVPAAIPPAQVNPTPQPQTPKAAPIPDDVKSVSQATPIVPRPPEFGLAPNAQDTLASGQVKQAAADAAVQAAADTTPPPPPPDPPAPPPQESRQMKMARLLEERFIKVDILDGMHFTHRGVCTKCGWQTMQLSDDGARQLLRQHVQQHWRDVASQL